MSKFTRWEKSVRKKMIDKGLTCKKLSEELGFSRPYVSGLINGKYTSPVGIGKLTEFLGVKPPETIVNKKEDAQCC